jgi:hypothetical protein
MSHPLLYEINTRCWLGELSDRHQRAITLATVPDAEFALWQQFGFTHIWLMGAWPTGPRARAIALNEPGLRRAYDEVLPGWRDGDVGGSPYSIAAYEVSPALGGDTGLKAFRAKLHQHGMKLILDFVPNHVGIDHEWVGQQPELFVQSTQAVAGTFEQTTATGPRWIANGKDPYFAPWTDVAQLDYRRPGTRTHRSTLDCERQGSVFCALDGRGATGLPPPGHAHGHAKTSAFHRGALRRRALRHGDAHAQ